MRTTVTVEKILKTDDYLDKEIKIAGFVRSRRDSKGFSFIDLNDGTTVGNLQVIVFDNIPDYKEKVLSITTGSSIAVEGKIRLSEGKGQKYELVAERIHIYGIAPKDYPLQKKHHTLEFLREIAHLRPRTNTIGAVMRMRSGLSFAIHSFFRERGFYYVHTPIITTSDCEGAGEMFTVTTLDLQNVPKDKVTGKVDFSSDFFGKEAHLTVSGQLEGEICALALSKIYTFGPTFRAENSNTPRHLAEFWMIEPEAAFYHLVDDMDLAEEFVKYLIKFALENHQDELRFFNERIDNTLINRLETVVNTPFERVSYTEAIKYLEQNNDNFIFKVKWGSDLQAEHERYLTETLFKKPVIVYDYPKEIKAFYMRQNDDGKTVAAMDLLVPKIGELIGGSEREERYELLLNRIRELKLKEENYWWYLDLRRFGGAPHSGFGLGFERLMLFVTGMQNIRDVIPFPRTPKNADF